MVKDDWIKYFDATKDKYTIEYYLKYGIESAIDSFTLPGKYKNKEQLYKECIETNKTWQDIVPLPPDGVLM